jgi:serine/threonine-protein kinase HipA
MTTERPLAVFAHLESDWVPCGQLSLSEDGPNVLASSFAYGLKYLERPHAFEVDPVSLSLREKSSVRGKVLYPANDLASFGGIRDAAPDAWGRRVIEAKLKAPANSLPESTYLIQAGSQRVGALDIRQSLRDAPLSSHSTWNDLQYLIDAAQRIDEGLPVPANLESIFDAGTALGGARPKATVRDEIGVSWLAKFSSRTDRLNVPIIENATLKLAAQAGLSVPPTRLMPLGSQSIILIRRFDRYWAPLGSNALDGLPADLLTTVPASRWVERRLPFVSGLTLLGCDELDSPKKSYGDLAHAIRSYCHADVIRADNRELYARMIYNIFVSNDDDHLRNHAFVWDPRLRGWRLSPLYDVLPRPSIAFERQLHLGVGPEGRAATLDNAYAARELFTLTPRDAADVITAVWTAVREWKEYFESYGVPADQVDKIASAFRPIDALASPKLRRLLD